MNVSLIFLTLCLVLVTPSVADTTADSTLGGQDPLQAALALVSSERMMRDSRRPEQSRVSWTANRHQ